MVGRSKLMMDGPAGLPDALSNGTFVHVGWAFRHTSYQTKENFDEHFYAFLKESDVTAQPMSHLYASANSEAELPSLAKYAKPQHAPHEADAWTLAQDFLFQHFAPEMMGSSEISSETAWAEMDRTTSPGYPWSIKFANKNDFAEFGNGRVICDDWYDHLESGTENPPIWTSSVKAEMLPVEKVLSNTRRTFTASPVEHNHATSRVCNDMNSRMFAAGKAGRVWSAVGMNKYARGWHMMCCRLRQKQRFRGVAFDAKQFDSSLCNVLFFAVWGFRRQMLIDEASKRRLDALYRHIIWSFIIMGDGHIVQKSTGNPSGSQNTTPDNTLCLYLLFAYAIVCEYRVFFGVFPSYEEVHSMFSAVFYGDDSILMATEEVWTWLDPHRIADRFAEFGVTLLPEDEDWTPRSLDQLSFLSQRIAFDSASGMWVPIPEFSKLVGTLLCGSTRMHPLMSLYRATALLCDHYWNLESRNLLVRFIEFLLRDSSLLSDPAQRVPGTEVTAADVRGSLRSLEQVRHMWTCLEEKVVQRL